MFVFDVLAWILVLSAIGFGLTCVGCVLAELINPPHYLTDEEKAIIARQKEKGEAE